MMCVCGRPLTECMEPTQEVERVIEELKVFLPEWNYPPYVVAAICLELRHRIAAWTPPEDSS